MASTMPTLETKMVRTAGNTLSWLAVCGLGAATVAMKAGCAPIPQDDSSKNESGFEDEEVIRTVAAILRDTGSAVILPSLEQVSVSLASLDSSLVAWEAAFEAGQDTTQVRADAQSAWTTAMLAWQEHEVMQVGPAGSSLFAIAGEDLADEAYSWPDVNSCRVDQELVYAGWDADGWFDDNVIPSYGFDAIEHLVYGGSSNTCPFQVDINMNGTWDALGDDGVEANRLAFARALTAHVADLTDELHETWSPDGGDFAGALSLTNARTPYVNDREALNAVFHALFYLETVTKDRKLAYPLGMSDECSLEICPDGAEHIESGLSVQAVAANLRGFRQLFTGGDAMGFDDLLLEMGHEDLSDRIIDRTDNAILVADATSINIYDGVETDIQAIQNLHAAVKEVTDLLKGDLVTVVRLQMPLEALGDND
jgi:predicted lipoprotein